MLAWFDRARGELTAAYRKADPSVRLPWFGPPMSLASSVTARLMETWAHGQDVLDTVGIARVPTARLRHVADLGIRALRYTYTVNGLAVPTEPVRVELAGPDGARWDWGPADAANRVRGTALDFCLLVTQRRHRDDTALEVTGAGRAAVDEHRPGVRRAGRAGAGALVFGAPAPAPGRRSTPGARRRS